MSESASFTTPESTWIDGAVDCEVAVSGAAKETNNPTQQHARVAMFMFGFSVERFDAQFKRPRSEMLSSIAEIEPYG
jgi:hypothetical protein